MSRLVWKAWAPPKIKFFAWLAIRNRLWMADHLEKRGWNNCGLCPLCKQTQEMVTQLFSHFRFTKKLWGLAKDWLGLPSIRTQEWTSDLTVKSWCTFMTS
jgi:hypothetical protein